jgi:hypothetical protein
MDTLRFRWRFAPSGEGFLRVFVDDELVREIDQRFGARRHPMSRPSSSLQAAARSRRVRIE